MVAVVMAGGQGTRLYPLTCTQPKPMLPLFGRPLLGAILQKLKKHSFNRVVITLHYRPAAIMDYFGNGADLGLQIAYAFEDKPLGTAGSVRHAVFDLLNLEEAALVVSGDVLFSFDLGPALDFHRRKKSLATVLLLPYHDPRGLGIAALDQGGRVIRYLEKPTAAQEIFSHLINTGIYILEPEALALIPPRTFFDFSKDLFPLMIKEKFPFFGFVSEGYWSDLGTLELYRQAHELAFAGKGEIQIPGEEIAPQVWVEEGVRIAAGAVFNPPLFLGAGVFMEEGAVAGPAAVIGAETVLGRGARVVRSILGKGNRIGMETTVRDSFFAEGNIIEEHCCLQGVVLGEYCVVSSHSTLQHDVKVWPCRHLPPYSFLQRVTIDD